LLLDDPDLAADERRLREAVESLRATPRVWAEVQADRDLRESLAQLDKYADPYERYRGPDGSIWMPVNESRGKQTVANWQPFRTDGELDLVRDESRWFAINSEWAINLLENFVSYTVGTGHTYSVSARPGRKAAVIEDHKQAAQRLIDDFVERNDWHDRQQEKSVRYDRDGEYFLRLFRRGDGFVVRFVEPEQVRTPSGKGEADRIRLGVQHAQDDVETIEGYYVDEKPVLAETVQHVKANVDRTAPRGLPTLYPIRDNLRRAQKLLRNISVASAIQTAIAMVRKHAPGTTSTGVQRLLDQTTETFTKLNSSGQRTTGRKQTYPEGTILDAPGGMSYEFPAAGINVANYTEALAAELRACASRCNMPEYMVTADASNANYASTLVAEGPAVKSFERRQAKFAAADKIVLWQELRYQAQLGKIDPAVLDLIEIVATPPKVVSRDYAAEMSANSMLVQAGVMSKKTAAEKAGLDSQHEKDQAELEAQSAGTLPGLGGW
jgi:hypothetical protein